MRYVVALHALWESGKTQLLLELRPILFDPDVAPKKVNRSQDVDKVTASAVNFYANVTEAEVNAFYDGRRRLDRGVDSRAEFEP